MLSFSDTADSKIDIVNKIRVIEALKAMKNVNLLVLSIYKSLSDSGQCIQKISV